MEISYPEKCASCGGKALVWHGCDIFECPMCQQQTYKAQQKGIPAKESETRDGKEISLWGGWLGDLLEEHQPKEDEGPETCTCSNCGHSGPAGYAEELALAYIGSKWRYKCWKCGNGFGSMEKGRDRSQIIGCPSCRILNIKGAAAIRNGRFHGGVKHDYACWKCSARWDYGEGKRLKPIESPFCAVLREEGVETGDLQCGNCDKTGLEFGEYRIIETAAGLKLAATDYSCASCEARGEVCFKESISMEKTLTGWAEKRTWVKTSQTTKTSPIESAPPVEEPRPLTREDLSEALRLALEGFKGRTQEEVPKTEDRAILCPKCLYYSSITAASLRAMDSEGFDFKCSESHCGHYWGEDKGRSKGFQLFGDKWVKRETIIEGTPCGACGSENVAVRYPNDFRCLDCPNSWPSVLPGGIVGTPVEEPPNPIREERERLERKWPIQDREENTWRNDVAVVVLMFLVGFLVLTFLGPLPQTEETPSKIDKWSENDPKGDWAAKILLKEGFGE